MTKMLVKLTTTAWQWEATLPNGDTSLMLNTDFEMFFDLRKKIIDSLVIRLRLLTNFFS
jgi:hypothetical protein